MRREVFGPYLPYRTWDPRPVAGTAGLQAMSWHPAHEQWGATQMQNRFQRAAKRFMLPIDYQAWVAVRAIGESISRVGSGDFAKVDAYICAATSSDLAAFKGQKVTFRKWDGQLRQPILVAGPDLPVSISPQQGFLHETRRGRHARHRRAGEQMQIPMNNRTTGRIENARRSAGCRSRCDGVVGLRRGAGRGLYRLRLQREGELDHRLDSATLEVKETIPVGMRPRGIMLTKDDKYLLICASDDDTVQVVDVNSHEIVGDLPSGPDPELLTMHPSGNPVYIANEDDNLLTVIDINDTKVLAEVEVGVEPEGVGISPDGKTVVVTSETTNMAHFIDTESFEIIDNVLVGSRPRFAEFTADGTQLWVTSEVAGTVSVIDAKTRKIIKTIGFEIPGMQAGEHSAGRRACAEGREQGLRGSWARPITWR